MKKALAVLLSAVMAAGVFTACGGNEEGAAFDATKAIAAITREEGSGTRGAFIELTGVEQKNADGEKVDMTSVDCAVQKSTQAVLTAVSNNEYAIGYISLGTLNNTVKAVKVEGVEATAENVSNGTYKLSRPFNIATKGTLSDAAQDFVNYILSEDGKTVIEENGYVSVSSEKYESNGAAGTVKVSGSSSVSPLMEKLIEAYGKVNTNVKITLNTSDSTTGMEDAADGTSDIGMASRELKDSEKDNGLTGTVIAQDGIAVIVNKANTCEDMTIENIMKIYTGETTVWEGLAK